MKTEKTEFSLVVKASAGKSHARERLSLTHTHAHTHTHTHTHTLHGMIGREPENSGIN